MGLLPTGRLSLCVCQAVLSQLKEGLTSSLAAPTMAAARDNFRIQGPTGYVANKKGGDYPASDIEQVGG